MYVPKSEPDSNLNSKRCLNPCRLENVKSLQRLHGEDLRTYVEPCTLIVLVCPHQWSWCSTLHKRVEHTGRCFCLCYMYHQTGRRSHRTDLHQLELHTHREKVRGQRKWHMCMYLSLITLLLTSFTSFSFNQRPTSTLVVNTVPIDTARLTCSGTQHTLYNSENYYMSCTKN